MKARKISIDSWMNKEDVVHICNRVLLSNLKKKKKNEITPFPATWMNLDMIIPSEKSQTEKDKYPVISLMHGIKNDVNELIYKTETTSQT